MRKEVIQNHERSTNEESENKCNVKKKIIIIYKQRLFIEMDRILLQIADSSKWQSTRQHMLFLQNMKLTGKESIPNQLITGTNKI